MVNKYTRVYADIDLDAIVQNVESLMESARGVSAMAVVKADAYGHGDVAVALAVYDKVDAYAVATAEEALNLRNNGIDKMILVLGYVDESYFEQMIDNNIALPLFDLDTATLLSKTAQRMNKKAVCHIKVDTGMRRIGLEADDEGADTAVKICSLPGISAEGIFTHFATADETDKTRAYHQLDLFNAFIRKLEGRGINFKYRHCANSAAVIEMPDSIMNMVRLGIAMYGMYPSDFVNHNKIILQPVMQLKSFVTMVKTLPAGERIGYGGTYITSRQTVVATVETGYGDGYPRNLSNKGYVLIRGEKAPIIGRICMDQFMVDVTDISDVTRGDIVTLIGSDRLRTITVEEMADLAGTFNYEFVCVLGKRIPRRYYRHGRLIGSRDYFYENWQLDKL